MSDIEDLVRRLTEPSFEHVFQKHPDGDGRAQTVELPPLLVRMRDRFAPSSGSDAGSKSMKSTRSPGDLDAMFEYAKIAAQITDWCRLAKVTPTRNPVRDLRAWHHRVKAVLADHDAAWYRRELARWVGVIRDHLEGVPRFVPRVPCPVCGGTSWGDQINGGDLWPIQVRWREGGTDRDWVARCRIPTCGTVWSGREAIEELGEEVAERTDKEN